MLVKSCYTKKKIQIYIHGYICNVYLSICIDMYMRREEKRKICIPRHLPHVILETMH